MIENNPSNVTSAFEILLEEIEAEIDFVNGIGARSFESRDYEKVREAMARSETLTAFRDRTAALRKDWQELAAAVENEDDDEIKAERQDFGRLRKGQRTPESAYYIPILEVLASLGGSGKAADVLEKVGQLMKPVLKDVDFDPLASNPSNPRWRNAAQWARNSMVQEGLLKTDSPHGVWEISDGGRALLSEVQR